ncbi:RNA-dependent RNA polymerase [Isaria javanica chrysovirus 1]|uniref:RNA-directed RNA polymerase n=1 Tax=Isaria javanica chrysovirus 1 TaxID=1930960 RepID=A0A1L6KW07_9VIRU|nr:RNA-dependent RNA polymerase [Isaria javanica chrysovirus 1]APR73428.1 RNA-dependent RNA polymerase [Isaria javanica chrysovirus 1]
MAFTKTQGYREPETTVSEDVLKNTMRGAVKAARRRNKPGLVSLAKYAPGQRTFLGQSKSREEYEVKLANSMARYEQIRSKRQNLFAFVMPAGHGKSTLARKYGFVDVDELITEREHDYYIEMRTGIMCGRDTWTDHNSKWYPRLNQTLDLLDYTMPVIIMLHTEELALELGAIPIGYFKLEKNVFMSNIEKRDALSKHFSILSYNESIASSKMRNQVMCSSNEMLERSLLEILNLSSMPVACPHKFSSAIWNNCYARTVPGWILRGERAGEKRVDINMLRQLFEVGDIPKECVDYYVKHSYVPTQFDFGMTMFDWSKELAHLPPTFRDRTEFDTEGDMIDIFPPQCAKELTRANVTIRQLRQTFDIFSHPDALEIAEYHVGEPHVFVSSILSAWKGIIQKFSVAEIVKPWFKVSFRNWSDRLKSLHSLVRCSRFLMNTEITEEERQGLMYMDLLVGRGEYKIDEMNEVRARYGDGYGTKHLSYDPVTKAYTNKQYKKDFELALDAAHLRLKVTPRKVNVLSFLDFYERRRSWLTKGGLVNNTLPKGMKEFSSQIFDGVANTVEEIRGRHNKKSLFEMHELYDILAGVNGDNFNTTKTMIKYEVGRKDRTLLPGSLAHFIVFSYVLVLAEKQDQIGSVRLNALADVDIRYFDRKMSTGTFHVLYDWADFNEQHSADEMAGVIRKLSETMPAGPDYPMFCEALVRGMYTMGLEDREGVVHKIWTGLYSGWRGTTWINSTLNFCYVFIALENLRRITGSEVVLMVDHGGDDLDLMLSQPDVMPLFLEIMDNMLFKANKWKQMFGLRSEFFRNTISGARVFASPTRALASFIAGDWEGAGRSTVRERVGSLLDQIGKLRRRGVAEAMCQGFAMSTISHWCKVKEGEEWLDLPDVVLHGCEEQNGLGIPDRNNEVWILEKPVPQLEEGWYKVVVPDCKASRDYVRVLSRDVEQFSLVLERQEELARKLAEDSYDIEKTLDRVQWRELLSFDCKVLGKRPVIEVMEDQAVFESFLEFEPDEDMATKFNKAARFQEYCGNLSFNGMPITKEELVDLMSDGEVSVEAIEFTGDIYYQRLVPEFIANRAVTFCRAAINGNYLTVKEADRCYKIVCWMASRVYRHMV